MVETIFRASRSRPEVIPAPSLGVVDAAAPSRSRAPSEGEGASCEHGTPGRTGRAPRGCPEEQWQASWTRPLDAAEQPRYLMANARRCYAAGRLAFSVHRLEDGWPMWGGQKGRGEACLEAGDGLVYQPDSEGVLRVHVQQDGAEHFWASLYMSGDFRRPLVARVGDTLVIQGVERAMPHGSTHEPSLSSIEVWPIGEPRDIGPTRQLRPGIVEPVLYETTALQAAAWRGGVVTTEPGRLVWLTLDLRPTGVLRGEFRPVAFSVDEAGWTHLIVDEANGPRALWVLTPEGGRTLRYVLPCPLERVSAPPLVGYGHRVTLAGGGQLLTLEPDGAIAWSRPIAKDAAGFAVTADDHVLVSEGREVAAFDATGQRRVLYKAEEPLVTAPVLTTTSRLLVASANTLYCLIPTPEL